MTTQELEKFCAAVRRDIINMTANAGSGHPGGSLSAVEMMSAAFCTQMRVDPKNPRDPNRDRFVLSKGHAAPCYYGILAELGFFSKDEFKNFRQLHSILQGHPDAKKVPGVDASTGSLGQGVSIAVGMALAAKHMGKDTKVFAMCGDGEVQEGQIWEAFMSAAHYKLDNLTVLFDNNGLQIDGSNDEVMAFPRNATTFTAVFASNTPAAYRAEYSPRDRPAAAAGTIPFSASTSVSPAAKATIQG